MQPMTLNRRSVLALSAGATVFGLVGCRSAVSGETGAGTSSLAMSCTAPVDPSTVLRRNGDTPAWINLVFDRLIDLSPKTFEPVPWLATAWEWAKDRSTLTLTLRDDVKFHSGRPFGPEDVIFSLNKAREPEAKSQIMPLINRISKIEKSGEHEVTLTFGKPTRNIFEVLTFNPIVDSETYAGYADGKKVIGTGPYTWDSYTSGVELKMSRYADYWDKFDNPIETVTLRTIGDPQAQLSAIRSGQVQVVSGIPGRDVKPLAKEGYVQHDSRPTYQQAFLGVDIKIKPFDDIRARQALQWAVDRERIRDQVYGGFGNVSSVPWNAFMVGVTPDQVTRYKHDPAKAKKLLSAAGATGAAVTITASNTPIMSSVMDIVTYDLQQIGLKPTPKLVDSAEFGDKMNNADFKGLYIHVVGTACLSPLTAAMNNPPLRPTGNTSHFENKEYQHLINQAFAAKTDEEIETAYHALSELMLKQSFHITLTQAFEVFTWNKKLQGAGTSVLGYLKLNKASLK